MESIEELEGNNSLFVPPAEPEDLKVSVTEDSVHFRLNRPSKLNSTTHYVIHTLNKTLRENKGKTVTFTSEGERAFCAGGDVVRLVELAKSEEQLKSFLWFDFN